MKPRILTLALLSLAALTGCRELLKEPAPPPPQKLWCRRIAGPEAMSRLHEVWAQHQSASLVVMRDVVFECPCDRGKTAEEGPAIPDGGESEASKPDAGAEARKAPPAAVAGRRYSGGDEQIGCWVEDQCRGYRVSGHATARFYDGIQLVDALDRCIH